ncbi:MAG: methyltransferase domain-containing protein [Planctomycetota bacterium]|jgi:glycosyltransferase involved in cell wall biosynthesis/SAM-dependent methyltransferase
MGQPRISILIPNYNNGRTSSRNGCRDFIGDLFQSLMRTLADDPTPLEIIVADDGSTDDSLATCRQWANRSWRGWRRNQPFCRLIERKHCGVLSTVANVLTRKARGELCCRLDGDIIIETPQWAARLCETFDHGPPTLGIVGPKQLGLDGRIHSAGSWILHPRGHHHIGQGADRDAVTRALEVDHVMGCFYCHRKTIWEALDGYDERLLRGQTIDFGLRARLQGWRTFSVPTIEFVHCHAERAMRLAEADSPEGIKLTLDRFEKKWGFNRLAPDLDIVAEKYAGTPLLWNPRVFGPATPWPPPGRGPLDIIQSAWARYAHDSAFRQAIDRRVALLDDITTGRPAPRRVLQVNCRSGLFCHLIAGKGLACWGVDPDRQQITLARQAVAEQQYPGAAPAFFAQDDPRTIPVEDGTVDAVLVFDALETHPNPVALLSEAHRVLAEGGTLAIIARERTTPLGDDYDALHAYRPHELLMQVQGCGWFEPLPIEPSRPIPAAVALIARRRPLAVKSPSSPEPVPALTH